MIDFNGWTRAEIDLDALEQNLRVIRAQLEPGCRAMAMIKADAYGHGALPVARCLEAAGVDYFGVANIFEAASLREGGVKTPILIVGYTPVELTDRLIEYGITQAVQGFDIAKRYADEAKKLGGLLKVHIKLDTGMSRCGIVCHGRIDEAAMEAARVCALEGLDAEGIFTHFADSDGDSDTATQRQISDFTAVLNKLEELGVKNLIKHCANSAAVLKYKRTHLDMVRAGIALYGISPLEDGNRGLQPVMTLKTLVTQIKTISAGEGVSYGLTWKAERPTRIATVPIGYGDGFRRAYSGAMMSINGRKAPVVGRVCMDLCMLDVTELPDVQEGDEVVVFGAQPYTTAEELAARAGTISYEVVTDISKRVLRLYLREGKAVERLSYI